MANDVGRPTDKTPEVVAKLTAAFHNGFNIQQACHYAGIHKVTYYRWLAADERFSYEMEAARGAPNAKAKEVVLGAVQAGDVNAAKFWLDRRDPEFKQKGEMDVNHGLQETRDKIKDFLDDRDNDLQNDSPPIEAGGSDEVAGAPPDIS